MVVVFSLTNLKIIQYSNNIIIINHTFRNLVHLQLSGALYVLYGHLAQGPPCPLLMCVQIGYIEEVPS